jgi:hypothetical protein
VMVRDVKVLPDESATSKYCPVEENVGAATGSDPYWATVSAPTPILLAVVLSLVAVAVPVELDDVPLCELVEPVGAVGAVGGVTVPGTVTVSAKLHDPVSPAGSESVPVTVYVLTARGPLVVTAPLVDTKTWAEEADVFST